VTDGGFCEVGEVCGVNFWVWDGVGGCVEDVVPVSVCVDHVDVVTEGRCSDEDVLASSVCDAAGAHVFDGGDEGVF
tara:strand:- start:367 stop:594 length:228 start_codon:yes stop_codon:yes gene_type:complete